MNREPHSNHPGYGEHDCSLRITVTAKPYGTSSNGYACDYTGGHCLPGAHCEFRRKDTTERAEAFLLQ